MRKNINFIVAIDKNNGIGYNNDLLTHLPSDLKRFKELTTDNVVIMGHNTFKSLKREKGLPNRLNIVLTREVKTDNENVKYINDINKFIDNYNFENKDIFVIGGSSIYKSFSQLKGFKKTYYITEIDNSFENVDTFFPIIIDDAYLVGEEFHGKDEKHQFNYIFKKYIV